MEKQSHRDTRIVDIHIRKKGFPAGVFFLLFIMLSLVLAGGVIGYSVYVGKQRIGDIESYTKNYSITLVNTFAGAVELGYKGGSGEKMKAIFGEMTQKNTFDEAFFVLRDGTLVAHSIGDVVKELRGNILNDEMSYNRDLILKPLQKSGRDVQFTDYNIITKRVPFNRMERALLKQYLYDGIDTSGWLVSRTVYQKDRPAGTVNLIIGKDRIFEFIRTQWEESGRMILLSLGIAFALSFLMALVIFVRYRTIQRDTLAQAEEKLGYRIEEEREVAAADAERAAPAVSDMDNIMLPEEDEIPVIEPHTGVEPHTRDESIAVELFDRGQEDYDRTPGRVIDLYSARRDPDAGRDREIKDAIPLAARRRP